MYYPNQDRPLDTFSDASPANEDGEVSYTTRMVNRNADDLFDIWTPSQRNSVVWGIFFVAFLLIVLVVLFGAGAVIAYSSMSGAGDTQAAFMINLENANLKAMLCANAERDVLRCQFLSEQLKPHTGYDFDCDPSVIAGFYPSFCPATLRLLDSTIRASDVGSVLDHTSESFSEAFSSLQSHALSSPSTSSSPHSPHS